MKFEIDFSETDIDNLNFLTEELSKRIEFSQRVAVAEIFNDDYDDYVDKLKKTYKTIENIKTSIVHKIFKPTCL